MHKNIAVAEIEIDEATGFIQKINEVFTPERLPLGIPVVRGTADRTAFNDWVDGALDSRKPFRYPRSAGSP